MPKKKAKTRNQKPTPPFRKKRKGFNMKGVFEDLVRPFKGKPDEKTAIPPPEKKEISRVRLPQSAGLAEKIVQEGELTEEQIQKARKAPSKGFLGTLKELRKKAKKKKKKK